MHAAPLKRVGRLTLLLVVCLPMDTHPVSRPSLLHDLRRIAHRTGTRVTPRLSISPDHRAGAAGRTTLGPTSPEVLAVAKRVNHALADGAGAEALHASALLDLVWGNSAESAGRVIATLETVQQLAEPSATLLADLSAAYLVRAQRAGTPRDLFASVEAAAAALELEPRNAAARFNLALALHRIGLH
ncbi:MAG TPA: hypothetical protein VHG28_17050, partial [Longimicrobiaceae bacterium]|nr:hypothetical protein [Longimicrobiaceae bacterium]